MLNSLFFSVAVAGLIWSVLNLSALVFKKKDKRDNA